MTKTATSIIRAMNAAAERGTRNEKAFKTMTNHLEGNVTFNRTKYLKAQDAWHKGKGKKTKEMADGKLAKKFKGTVKNIKKKLSVGDFFSKNKQGSPSVAMA